MFRSVLFLLPLIALLGEGHSASALARSSFMALHPRLIASPPHCPPAYDEDSDALAGAALGSPSVMSNRQFVAGALRGPRGPL